MVRLRLSDTTQSKPGGMRAARGHHRAAAMEDPPWTTHLARGCKGGSKRDEMDFLLPKG